MVTTAIRVPAALCLDERVGRLVERVAATGDLATLIGAVDRAAVLRLALARGLDALEAEYGLKGAAPAGAPKPPEC